MTQDGIILNDEMGGESLPTHDTGSRIQCASVRFQQVKLYVYICFDLLFILGSPGETNDFGFAAAPVNYIVPGSDRSRVLRRQ